MRGRWGAGSLLALWMGLALAACAGNGAVQIVDTSGEEWMMREDHCLRESLEGPMRRVINRVDPELCGRSVRPRSPVYVRILPPLSAEQK